MRLRLLGSTTFDGNPLTIGARDRQLLALLAATAPDAVSRTAIVDELWAEAPPKNPANAVQASVSRLRKKLGDVIELTDAGYRLALEPSEVDLAVVEGLVDRSKRSEDLDERVATTGAAVDLLASGLDGVTPTVERWFDAVAIEAREMHAEALVEARRFPEATRHLDGLAAAHPFRESIWGLLMRSLYGEGRQAEALRTFQRASDALAEAGITPGPGLTRLEERILLQDPSLATSHAATTPSSLPLRRTSMVGRSADVRAVRRLLAENRLVTVTGLGGIGKTTLATEIAHGPVGQAWFVDLTAISEDDDVAQAIADTIVSSGAEGSPLERIIDRLIGTSGLLVLDNCEHVAGGAAATVSALLDRLPELSVLATSREPLRIRGEQVYPIGPLGVDVDGAAQELFEARIEAIRPGASGGVDRESILDICRMVDGIPLAIEIVASAAAAMTIDEIRDRLRAEAPLPTAADRDRPIRHSSLEAVVEWSLAQLTDEQRRVFARLSVFADGARLAAVEQVCGFDPVPAERIGVTLGELIRSSLLTLDDGGRYRQLWLVRRLAARGLTDDESIELHRRFVRWCASLVHSIGGQLRHGIEQVDALTIVDAEAANLRHALRSPWGDRSDLVDIAHALVWSSTMRVGSDDSIRLAEAVLEDLGDPPSERYVEARLGIALSDAVGERRADHPTDGLVDLAEQVGSPDLVALALGVEALRRADRIEEAVAMVHDAQGRTGDRWLSGVLHIIEANLVGYVAGIDAALEAAEAAVTDLEQVHDRWRMATALSILGTLRQMTGGYGSADSTFRQVLEIADEMGLAYDRYLALTQIANTALLRGDLEGAIRLAHQALASTAPLGGAARANGLNTLGRVSNALGRFDDARVAHTEALRIYTGLDAYAGIAHSLDNLGLVASRSGDPAGGARQHLRALEINAEKGDPLSVAFSLEGLALSLALQDGGDDAARLLGAAHALRSDLGLPLPDGERRYVDAASALARESTEAFESAFEEGRRAEWRALVERIRGR